MPPDWMTHVHTSNSRAPVCGAYRGTEAGLITTTGRTHAPVMTKVSSWHQGAGACWAVTSTGFFWPIFPIVCWGIGVVMNAWDVWRGDEFSEKEIAREIDRLQKSN